VSVADPEVYYADPSVSVRPEVVESYEGDLLFVL
jgi:hypothetical protein